MTAAWSWAVIPREAEAGCPLWGRLDPAATGFQELRAGGGPSTACPPSAQTQAVSAAATFRPALLPLTVLVPVSAVAMSCKRVHTCTCECMHVCVCRLLRLLHSMLSQDLRVLDTQRFPVFRLSDLSKSACQPPAFGSRCGDPLPLWGSGAGAGEAWRVDPASWRLAG